MNPQVKSITLKYLRQGLKLASTACRRAERQHGMMSDEAKEAGALWSMLFNSICLIRWTEA